MDALLRYLLYRIAFTLLSIQLILMISCVIAIIIIKIITKAVTQHRNRIQKQISSLIEKALFQQSPIDQLTIPLHLRHYRSIVEVLERFNQRFSDEKWMTIKEKITTTYLLPQCKRYCKSWSWFKRQLAARSCLLCPHKADKSVLAILLEDDRYLVRVAAAVCITRISDQALFNRVIEKMGQETKLSRFPYRDALVQTDQEKYEWMELLLSTSSDYHVIAICLDILATRYSTNLLPLVKPFVNAANKECRILALKALSNIPTGESIELLIQHLDDSDWEMRANAILGLQKLYAVQAISKLNPLLNDPVWWVRLQAALTLKSFGKEGVEVLVAQDQGSKPRAHEIAQYTLALP